MKKSVAGLIQAIAAWIYQRHNLKQDQISGPILLDMQSPAVQD
jgi:hypothetical protein